MTQDPFRKATSQAAWCVMNALRETLMTAMAYNAAGKDLAAWGTLTVFDEQAEDLKAAIRLHRAANRRPT